VLRSGIVKYEFSKNYLYNMKYQQGDLTEADIKARRRFWNKRGFFGEPKKKELERSSLKMQKLLAAMKGCTREEIERIIRISPYTRRFQYLDKQQTIIWEATMENIEYALRIAPKTFKVNQSSNI
jgi:hypothetical protein